MASLKDLLAQFPQDYAALAGFARRAVSVVDSDVSTISAAVDFALRGEADPPALLHLEVQSSHQADLPRREFVHNVLLWEKHDLPVRSVILFLRREAWRSSQNGSFRVAHRDGWKCFDFEYQVIKIWEMDPRELLGRLGTLPLAPLARVEEADLPDVLERIERRLAQEPQEVHDRVAAATYVLAGLRFELELVESLVRRHPSMKESVTYQAILKEGREEGLREGLREAILRVGRRRFGAPDASIQAALEAMDAAVLERLIDRLPDADCWADLLAR